jgi:drug/metabolite transporter (DMT)-like permease
MTIYLGILLALACAFTTNLAFLYKHRGACAAPAVHVHHPLRSARGLFRSRWFAIGMLVAVGAWTLHVGALALAPMSVVQAVLAGGVVLLAVMAERLFGFRVGPRQWLGLGLTAAGLVLLGVTLPAVHGAHSSYSLPGMIAFEAGLIGVGALLIIGKRIGAPDHHHGVMLGAAAGFLFGVSDVAIKAITGLVQDAGLLGGLLNPWTVVAAAASVVAFYASAKGLQEGEAVPVIALTGVAANVAGIAGGIVVFGDPLPRSTLGIALQALAFLLVIVAAALTPAPVRAAQPARAAAAA